MAIWLVETGLVSILGQVVVLRELNVAYFGSELIYVLAFGFWLLGTAIGALLGKRNYLPNIDFIRWLFLSFGVFLVTDLFIIRRLHNLFGGVPGAYLPFFQQIAGLLLTLLPMGIVTGMLFQFIARHYIQKGKSLALAYAVEGIGGLAGGAFTALSMSLGLSNFDEILICCLVCFSSSLHRFGSSGGASVPNRLTVWLSVWFGSLAIVMLYYSNYIDFATTSWSHPQLLDTIDTPYGRTTISGTKGQISIFYNNALLFENQGIAAEEFVHMAALHCPDLRSVLILGGGIEGLIREVQQHKPRTIDYVELDKKSLDMALRFLPSDHLQISSGSPVRMVYADPRDYLNHTKKRYDLILIGMPEPDSAQTNRFYTKEFFLQCGAHLTSSGVLAFRLHASENLWTKHYLRRASSVRQALKQALNHIRILPASTNIFVASKGNLVQKPETLIERFESRDLNVRMISNAYIMYLLTNDRVLDTRKRLELEPTLANSDIFPICYQHAHMIWLAKFFPTLTEVDLSERFLAAFSQSPEAWILLIIVLPLLWQMRKMPKVRRASLSFVAGFWGIVVESTLILHYQVKRGVLFQDLGLLLTFYMAGLVFGAASIYYCQRYHPLSSSRMRWMGMGLIVGFIGFVMIIIWRINHTSEVQIIMNGLGLFLCGALASALFSYASLINHPDQLLIVSPLYSADLLGGCLGSLAASLLLLPILGFVYTLVIMVIVSVIALILVV